MPSTHARATAPETGHHPSLDNSVATQLHDLIGRASAAIAGRETWGREKLEILRRDLVAACEQARTERRGEVTARMVLEDLCAGVERGVLDLGGLASRARGIAHLPADQGGPQ